jgi:DNA repair exonuclease SbcCD ATPase subunit
VGVSQGEIRQLEAEVAKWDGAIAAANKKPKDVLCPQCGNTVTETSLAALKVGYAKAKDGAAQSVAARQTALKALLGQKASVEQRVAGLPSAQGLNQETVQLQSILKDIEVAEQRSVQAQYQLSVLKKPSADNLVADIASKKEELAQVEATLQPSLEELAVYSFWNDGFGPYGIKSLLLDSVCPALTESSNRAAMILTDGALRFQWLPIDPTKDRDHLTIRTWNDYGHSSYGMQSGAEGGTVDLCVRFALQELAESRAGKPLNLRVYDEPFSHMDDTLVERVMTMLQEQAKQVGTVLVITHDTAIKNSSLFQSRYRVVKKDGISTLYKVQ